MPSRDSHVAQHARPLALAAVVTFTLAALGYALGHGESRAQSNPAARAGMNMSDAAMARAVAGWFAAHPARGTAATVAPVDSFVASGFTYNIPGDAQTIDTAFVTQGDVVLFKWGSGSHTITNGTGSTDPNAGLLFDQPLTSTAKSFAYQFNTVGTVPFFCRIHESFNMRGVVVVSASNTGVGPARPAAGAAGFVRPPWPNPTRGGAAFQFALARPGHARIDVHDALGRRIATVLDGTLAPGSYRGSWDGRVAGGGPAPAGVYEVRLAVPGAVQSRRVTLLR
jgi:plastocyanin